MKGGERCEGEFGPACGFFWIWRLGVVAKAVARGIVGGQRS